VCCTSGEGSPEHYWCMLLCCIELQCVAVLRKETLLVYTSVLQCVAVCCTSEERSPEHCGYMLLCCSVLQCVAVRYSALQWKDVKNIEGMCF